MAKAKYGMIVLLLTVAISLAGDRAGARGKPEKDSGPPTVTVAKVPVREVNPAAEFVGRVEAMQAVDLRVRVDGYIKQVAFDEGARVKQGDLLFLIDEAPYRAKLNEAKAKVALAQAALDKALRYLNRLKSVRAGGVAATDMDTALAAEQTARAQFQEARAGLEAAQLNLGYTVIRAPIRGRIGRVAFTTGNLVNPSSGPLAHLVQLNPIRVVWSISENEYVAAKMKALKNPDQAMERLVPRLKLPNGQLYPEEGRMDFTEPQVDPTTGTIAVRAEFKNPQRLLLPGQYVTVLISRQTARRLPVVPQAAVLEDRQGMYVLMVDKTGKVIRRGIVRGAAVGDGWAVEKGLAAGEEIIVHGLQKAGPGRLVRPVRAGGK